MTPSQVQEQLKLAASYGYGQSNVLLHPGGTALQEEYQLDDNTSSSSEQDDIAAIFPFLPLMQAWQYQKCDQHSIEASHQIGKQLV